MPPVGFEPTISAGERPKTLDRAATGTLRELKQIEHLFFLFFGIFLIPSQISAVTDSFRLPEVSDSCVFSLLFGLPMSPFPLWLRKISPRLILAVHTPQFLLLLAI